MEMNIHKQSLRPDLERQLAAGADPNAKMKNGNLPLIVAAEMGRVDFVSLLLDAGAAIDRTCGMGYRARSALLGALYAGHREVAEVLLERGAGISVGKKGLCAKNWAYVNQGPVAERLPRSAATSTTIFPFCRAPG